MAHVVVWSPRAIDDVDSIAAYIAKDSEAYAASVVRAILAKTRRLSEFPYSDALFLNLTMRRSVRSLPISYRIYISNRRQRDHNSRRYSRQTAYRYGSQAVILTSPKYKQTLTVQQSTHPIQQ